MPRERSKSTEEEKSRKLRVQHRLTREGRWEEASRFKEAVRKECKRKTGKEKMTADECVRASWAEMERVYPPLSEVELQARKDAAEAAKQDAIELDEEIEAVDGGDGRGDGGGSKTPLVVNVPEESLGSSPDRLVRGITIPLSWGELPQKATQEEDVEWIYQNYSLVVRRTQAGQTRIHLNRALTPCPCHGTIGLLEWAVSNRAGFYNLAGKVRKNEDEDAEEVKAERKSIAEIRGIIEQMEVA